MCNYHKLLLIIRACLSLASTPSVQSNLGHELNLASVMVSRIIGSFVRFVTIDYLPKHKL